MVTKKGVNYIEAIHAERIVLLLFKLNQAMKKCAYSINMQIPNETKNTQHGNILPAKHLTLLYIHQSLLSGLALHPSSQVDHSISCFSVLRCLLSIYQTLPFNFILSTV